VALELVENPDLLATVARAKGERLVVGFALETSDGLRRAREKLARKNADFVVLNGAEALNSDRASVTIVDRLGGARRIDDRSKPQLARALVALLDEAAGLSA
jgi:phosphopantothenoylcysteine decarboxylase/phosphopantothenate--cysteine ligase